METPSGNVRFGDYILIIDSDTRVPRDCLLDSVSEMEHNPRCAVLQHASGVMNVTDCKLRDFPADLRVKLTLFH